MAKKQEKHMNKLIPAVYDSMLFMFTMLVDLFFREVHPRGSWKIPRRGPVIFVAAPHANQFVDPLILMRVIKSEANRRIAWLIAEKSMKRKVIGTLAGSMGALTVGRALDSIRPAVGKIYLPDPVNDPTLIRGVGTKFDSQDFQVGGLIVLPSVDGKAANSDISQIISAEELRLKKPFKGQISIKQLTGRDDVSEDARIINENGGKDPNFEGTPFRVAPHIDQSLVYDAVFAELNRGGCIGIFPEGGSHDRTDLLPLKAGVAIMALGALAANPDCGVKIVPCGMNYFHAHKFRSRAVVEFGNPIEIPPELVKLYRNGQRREAVGELLETVYQALVAVTVTSPDYDTLMLIQAARRLYNPAGKKLPLPIVVELNRRLVKGYTHYKDDPRIVKLKKSVLEYNKQLRLLGIRDHQVEYAKFSAPKVIFTLIYRLSKLAIMSIGTLPGLILFGPVFIATKVMSIKKSREALAASTVKLQGRDVMATWKLLVAMVVAPLLYAFYTVVLTYWTYRNRVQGYVPDWVPLWSVVIFGMIIFPSITFAALRIGEIGMDILKSLRPLLLSLNPTSANTLVKLRERRKQLSHDVTDLINTLGPEMFPDFDSARIVADPFRPSTPKSREGASEPASPISPSVADASMGVPRSQRQQSASAQSQSQLPKNESFHNLSNIGLFASRPPSRSRSRTSSAGGLTGSGGMPLKAFSSLDAKGGFDEVSSKIRGMMRERGRERRKSEEGWILADGEGDEDEEGKKNA